MSSGVHVTRDQPIGRGPFNSISPASAVSNQRDTSRRYLSNLSLESKPFRFLRNIRVIFFRVLFFRGFLSGVILAVASVNRSLIGRKRVVAETHSPCPRLQS